VPVSAGLENDLGAVAVPIDPAAWFLGIPGNRRDMPPVTAGDLRHATMTEQFRMKR
jgi:hypothetical protein